MERNKKLVHPISSIIKMRTNIYLNQYPIFCKYETHLTQTWYLNILKQEQANRLLYISGLEYKCTKNITNIKVYLYSMRDFDRYIEVIRLLYKGTNLILRYKREEVKEFFRY